MSRGRARDRHRLIAIECDYSVPIELPGYSTDLEFHVSSKNRGMY